MLERLIDPVRHPEFLPGLAAGAVAFLAASRALRRGGWPVLVRRPAPVAGALLVVAVLVGLLWTGSASLALGGGLALLAAAALLGGAAGLSSPRVRRAPRMPGESRVAEASRVRRALRAPRAPGDRGHRTHLGRRLLAVAAIAAGMVTLTARLGPLASPWRLAVAAGGLVVTVALWQFDRRSVHAGLVPVLLLVTAGGIYATVPDTEEARVLLAAALPLALLGWPWRLARLGPSGALLVGGLLTWMVATGGHGRPGSIVGGLAAMGLLLAEPAARALSGRSLLDRLPVSAAGGAGIAVAHAALVLAAARLAGFRGGAAEAALVVLPLLGLTALVLSVRSRGRVSPPTG